jgi:ribosomal protein S18 acetylase RimI-like enzyme
MSAWALRRGTPADGGPVLDLWRAAGALPSATDTPAGLDRLLRHDPDSLLLAVADGEIVGSLIAAWDGWRGSFYRLAVHPAWRRRGIATDLIRSGEERLLSLGAARLTAIVAGDESEAAELWRLAGYEGQDERRRFVRTVVD